MKKQIKRVDRRFKGSGDWKYYIDVPKDHVVKFNFFEVQVWCWETWGPSKEISHWNIYHGRGWTDIAQNSKWCWHLDEWTARIYLKSDKEADWFSLKWS